MFFNKKTKPHVCSYDVIATNNEKLESGDGPVRTYTHVLVACKCGDWEIETHSGQFGMEDFKKMDEYTSRLK